MTPDAAQPVRRPLAAICAAFVFGTWLGFRTLGGCAAPFPSGEGYRERPSSPAYAVPLPQRGRL